MTVFTLQTNMTRGEITPYMHARVDTDFYQAGLALARNVIVSRFGGVMRCPGTRYVGNTKIAGKSSRFIPFEFRRDQVYSIEAGDQYFRFWTAAGRVESPPGTPIEVATPYLEADLSLIQVRQSGDVIYITCLGYQPRTLTRNSETSWTLADYVPKDGPYMEINTTATVLTPSDIGAVHPIMTGMTTPSGTVTGQYSIGSEYVPFNAGAGGNFYDGAHGDGWIAYDFPGADTKICDAYWIGAVAGNPEFTPVSWYFEGYDGSNWIVLDTRNAQTGWARNERRFFEFSNEIAFQAYRLRWTATDDNNQNDSAIEKMGWHEDGDTMTPFNLTASSTVGINDGAGFVASDVGRPIRFLGSDGRWRWMVIASRVSSTVVTVRLYGHSLPDLKGSANWRLGAWSNTSGWPSSVAVTEDRLTLARTDDDPLGIWYSKNGGYDDFGVSAPIVDDDGIAARLTGGKLNDISWLIEGRDLLAGTAGSLRAVGRNNPNSALSPSNIRQRTETLIPSSRAEPIAVENMILFMDFYEQRLYEAAYTYEIEGYLGREVSVLSEHLFAAGVKKIVYLSHPNRTVIGLRYDGLLVAFAYDRDQKIAGGTLIDIGGFVEDVSPLPGDTGTDLWLTVRRTLNGSTLRTIELLAEFWRQDFTVQDVPIYGACSVVYDGAATNTVAGVNHMKNESVALWCDGRDLGDVTVSNGGVVTLPLGLTASQIVIGKRMPWKVQTLRLSNIGNRDGSGLGRKTNIVQAYLDLYEAAGVSVRAYDKQDSEADLLGFEHEAEENPGEPVPLRTGMFSMAVDDSWRNNGVLVLQGDRMYPVTIRAIQLEIDGEP